MTLRDLERPHCGCVKPPDDWVLAEARRGVCSQRDQGLAESLQARPCAREACMMAVHDSSVIRDGSRCRAERADVLGDNAAVARPYGLTVMVSVPLTMLSCESCTCMGKLKVPALVGVPVRTLL